MQVAVFSVAENYGIGIAVLTKQPVEIVRRIGQVLHRKRDVFDNHSRAALTHRPDGRKHSGTNPPEQCLLRCGVREARGLEQLKSSDRILGQPFQLGTIVFVRRLEFDQQSSSFVGKRFDRGRHSCLILNRAQ